jgi:hypothetical protein
MDCPRRGGAVTRTARGPPGRFLTGLGFARLLGVGSYAYNAYSQTVRRRRVRRNTILGD